MTIRLEVTPSASGTELRLPGPEGALPFERWAVDGPPGLRAGTALLERLIAAGTADADAEVVIVENGTIAGLSAAEAEALGLPAVTRHDALVELRRLITRPDVEVRLTWQRPDGRPDPEIRRVGAWLLGKGGPERLAEPLFGIAEAVDAVAAAGSDDSARMAALAMLSERLPGAAESGRVKPLGALSRMRIVFADAFSLDLEGEGEAALLVPILHRSGGDPDAPVLAPEEQAEFGRARFHAYSTARGFYQLGGGTFVVLARPLLRALQVVREVQQGPAARRRQLIASPRAFLRTALGDETEATVLEDVFRETARYSERVVALGLWQPRVLPWIQVEASDWLDRAEPAAARPAAGPARCELVVDGRQVPLAPDALLPLRERLERAIDRGEASVPWPVGDETVAIPATLETVAAVQKLLDRLRLSQAPEPESGATGAPATRPEVLLIAPNEAQLDHAGTFAARRALPPGLPRALRTPLKDHQRRGLDWLQRAWAAGMPGVLLADDMGLGKTLQVLAFCASLRDAMARGEVKHEPIAIVAPTGLLENWQAEHDRHLQPPGLGVLLKAYGRGLAELKRGIEAGRPRLDVARLRQADWILTTYETLRDYDLDFGQVRLAALVLDEAQKVKTPAVRATDAAKAMNAEFRVAMTGTPVENRLADLWCIVDGVHPGRLGDLKSFSARFERDLDPATLRALKDQLERERPGPPPIPPLLLRRTREQELPDLPRLEVERHPRPMPPIQRDAYAAAIGTARGRRGDRGWMLEALQAIRAVSLHPDPAADVPDDAFVAMSARLAVVIELLDAIARRGEKALLFLEDLALQARLATLLQRRYDLVAPPAVINGELTGKVRQQRVDRFQKEADGFGCMILSPRAGGVGLTLTRATRVIHVQRWWNPAVEDQCNGRALRIGQTRPVTVHLPLATIPGGRSFDENLDALLERKRRLMQDALMPPAASESEQEELLEQTLAG